MHEEYQGTSPWYYIPWIDDTNPTVSVVDSDRAVGTAGSHTFR